MADDLPPPDPVLASIVDHVVAQLYPWLDPAAQREVARRSLGLKRLVPWADGRMVYVETIAGGQ